MNIHFRNIIILLLFLNTPAFAQKNGQTLIDSLESVLPGCSEDTNKVLVLARLSQALHNLDPEKGIHYAKKGIVLAEKLNYNRGLANLYIAMTGNYYMTAENTLALSYAVKAIELFTMLGDKNGLARSLSNAAVMLMNQGNHSKAMEYYFQALEINEEIGNEQGIATNQQNLGILYYDLKEYDKALACYQKSIEIFMKLHNENGIAGNYCNIGNVYSYKKEYDKDIENNQKALEIYQRLQDKSGVASCLANIGNAYFEKGAIFKAVEYNFKALGLNREIGNKNGEIVNSGNIGNLYLLLWKDTTGLKIPDSLKNKATVLEKAEMYTAHAIRLANEISARGLAQSNYNVLAEIENSQGNYKGAFENLHLSISIKDSIFSKENRTRIDDLEAKRNGDIKEKEIQFQKLLLAKIRNERWYFISGFIGLVILLLVILNRFRVKKRSNEKLESAYNELKTTQQQLIQQEKLASLGALTAGIAHEIKNPLNFVNNFSELSAEQIDELLVTENPEEKNEMARQIKENLNKIYAHGKKADSIVQSMLLHSRHGDPEKMNTDINVLCNEIADLAFHGMKSSIPDFNVEIKKEFLPGLPVVQTVPQDISRVLVNLLNNSFYALNSKSKKQTHSKDTMLVFKPLVILSTSLKGHRVVISVRDNGTGIPNELREKIFEPFFTTKPTGSGTGLGLSICYDIIQSHGGELILKSNEPGNTEFVIELPV